jgi:dihydropteroate synthase
MGILNLTPDSFSGDGLISPSAADSFSGDGLLSPSPPAPLPPGEGGIQLALEQARRFLAAGVDILDVGGESTRPDSTPVSAEQEMERVLPVIRLLASELDALISVDTYKAQVAEAAFQAGAHILNDIWGLRADPELAGVAARFQAPVILMHNRSSWASAEIRQHLGGLMAGEPYTDLLADVCRELEGSAEIARSAGIPDERIILDPGIGFGKTVEQNLELVDRLGEIRRLGYPVLLGPSRKSFIGRTLDLPADQRLEGTAASVAVGIARGADIIRVHDVEFMARVARMTDAIVRRTRE